MLTSSVQSPPPRTGANTAVASVSTDVIPSGYTAIYSAEDLNNVRNNLSGKYILMNDIDLSSIDDWESIESFEGIFNGNGHVIKNLKSTHGGLFRDTSISAFIQNIGLENVDIKSNGYVGGLVGLNSGQIDKCYVTGNVSGTLYVGGLVGLNQNSTKTVSNCYTTANVSGTGNVGGLFGQCKGLGTITDCYTSGNVTGKNEKTTGLICGVVIGSTISNIWADQKDSTLNAFGNNTAASNKITNCSAVSHKEFTSPEFWDKQNLDSDVWEMSISIPPVLKGVGKNNYNWYFRESSNDFRLQVGSGSDPAANALFVNTGLDLGAINIDLSTVEGCLDASRCAKAALDAVAKRTADIGIEQSRLETISNVNTTQIENLSAAYSTVTEADVAEEVANYTKAQIMAQAASSLMTQTQAFQANLLLRMINSLG